MPGNAGASSASTVLQAQITDLGDRMGKGFDEIKGMLREYEGRTRAVEQREASCQPMLTTKIDTAWRKLEDLDVKFAIRGERISQLMTMYRIFIFIGSALGLSIIALIWSLITGRAEVVFR